MLIICRVRNSPSIIAFQKQAIACSKLIITQFTMMPNMFQGNNKAIRTTSSVSFDVRFSYSVWSINGTVMKLLPHRLRKYDAAIRFRG